MDEETFNKTLRSFLKKVGINAQREIEQAVRKAVEDGTLRGDETLAASVVLRVPELDLDVTIEESLRLE